MGNRVAPQLRMQEMHPDAFLPTPSKTASSQRKDADKLPGKRSMMEEDKEVNADGQTRVKYPSSMLQLDRPSTERNCSGYGDSENPKRKFYTIVADETKLPDYLTTKLPDSTCPHHSSDSRQASDKNTFEKLKGGIESTVVKHMQKDSVSSFSIKITVEQIDGQRSSDPVILDETASKKVPMLSYTTSVGNSIQTLSPTDTRQKNISEKRQEKISHIDTADDLIHYIAAREFSKDKITSFNVTHSQVIDKIVHRVNNEMVEHRSTLRRCLEQRISSSDSPEAEVAPSLPSQSRQLLRKVLEERSAVIKRQTQQCSNSVPHTFPTPSPTNRSKRHSNQVSQPPSSVEEHDQHVGTSNAAPTQLQLSEGQCSPPQSKIRRTDSKTEEAVNVSSQKRHTSNADVMDTLPVITAVYSQSPDCMKNTKTFSGENQDYKSDETPSREAKTSKSKDTFHGETKESKSNETSSGETKNSKSKVTSFRETQIFKSQPIPPGSHAEPLDLSVSKVLALNSTQLSDAVPLTQVAQPPRPYMKDIASGKYVNSPQLPYMSPAQFSAFQNPLVRRPHIGPAHAANSMFNPAAHHYTESSEKTGRWSFESVSDPHFPVHQHVQKVSTHFRLPYPTYFSKPHPGGAIKPSGWNYRPPF